MAISAKAGLATSPDLGASPKTTELKKRRRVGHGERKTATMFSYLAVFSSCCCFPHSLLAENYKKTTTIYAAFRIPMDEAYNYLC